MNTKSDIPTEPTKLDVSETGLDVDDLPDPWHWGSCARTDMTNKVNIYFGYDVTEVGGQMGEIDNYLDNDGNEMWGVHTRPIVEAPSNPHGCRPRAEGAHAEEFESLDEAIDAVPRFIEEHYGGDE